MSSRDQLLEPKRLPAAAEACVASEERFRKTTVTPEGVEFVRLDRSRRADDPRRVGKLPGEGFGDRERVHPIREIASHQAVAATAVHIHAAAARHRDAYPVGMGVEEALEELLPARELVQLVEEDHGNGLGQPVQPEPADEIPRAGEYELPIVDVIPVDVGIGAKPAGGGLAHLARTAEERHLPVARQVLGQQGVVDAGCRHGRRLSIASSNSQDPFYDVSKPGHARTPPARRPSVYRELVHALGAENVFILSAGWGLLSADFLTPNYDITFSATAERYKRRRVRDVISGLLHALR